MDGPLWLWLIRGRWRAEIEPRRFSPQLRIHFQELKLNSPVNCYAWIIIGRAISLLVVNCVATGYMYQKHVCMIFKRRKRFVPTTTWELASRWQSTFPTRTDRRRRWQASNSSGACRQGSGTFAPVFLRVTLDRAPVFLSPDANAERDAGREAGVCRRRPLICRRGEGLIFVLNGDGRATRPLWIRCRRRQRPRTYTRIYGSVHHQSVHGKTSGPPTAGMQQASK